MIGVIYLFVFLVTAAISLTGVILTVFGVYVWCRPGSRHGPILTFIPILSAAGAVYGAFALFRYVGLCTLAPLYSFQPPGGTLILAWFGGIAGGAVAGAALGALLGVTARRIGDGGGRKRTVLLSALTAGVLVGMVGVIVRFQRHITVTIPNARASWIAGEMLVRYLNCHGEPWPSGWDDADMGRLVSRARINMGFEFEEVRSRVLIDWTADLATLRHGPVPAVPIIRLSDGTTPSWTRVPDGNRVLLDYASDLYARLREVPALDMTILVPSCPFRSVSVSPNALHYSSVWGWLEVSRSRIRLAGIDYGPTAAGDRIVLRRDGLLFVNGVQRLPPEPGG